MSLLGFGDFFNNDSVGADKGKGGKPDIRPPNKVYAKGHHSTAVEHHGKVLNKAKTSILKAAKALGKAQISLAYKAPTPAMVVKAAATTVSAKGLSGKATASHIGAAVTKPTPKQKAAMLKHEAAVSKAKDAAKKLAQHALKTKAAVKVLAKKAVAQKKIAKLIRTPLRKRSHMGALLHDPLVGALLDDPETSEETAELIGEYLDAVGEDEAPPPESDGGPLLTPEEKAALTADDKGDSGDKLPPAPDMNRFFSDMTTVGGIAYDGAKGTPDGYIVSYGMATRATNGTAPGVRWDDARWIYPIDWMNHYGYVWGKYDPPKGGFDGGEDLPSGAWNEFHGGKGRGDWYTPNVSEAFASSTKSAPNGVPYGPLVGNPAMKDFARMRVDGQGQAFWLPQEAPDWLTFPIKQAAALTVQKAKEAEDAQKKLDDAATAKTKADEQAAQSAQEAANALAETAATSEAKVAETKTATAKGEEEVKQVAAETQAQQQLVTQQQTEMDQDKSAGELMLAQAQRESAYLAAHPEEEFGPPPGAEEDGGGAEDTEEVAPPGGDMMEDSDGEGSEE